MLGAEVAMVEELLRLARSLIVIVAVGIMIVVLYFVMSPYQKCMNVIAAPVVGVDGELHQIPRPEEFCMGRTSW
tara:strand:+ start:17337 stop:17558 length:222 start_codon:yes stop_codon:yes gene_type:complete